MIISTDKVVRSDEQILAQIKSDPKALGIEEMLYAATLTKEANEKCDKFIEIYSCIHTVIKFFICHSKIQLLDLSRVVQLILHFLTAMLRT